MSSKKRNTTASLTSRLMNGAGIQQEAQTAQSSAAAATSDFHTKPASNDPKDYELTQEQIAAFNLSPELTAALNRKRTENVGRPRKDARKPQEEGLRFGDTRATFILKKVLVQKLKYIALMDTRTMKEMLGEVLGAYVEQWEKENGVINLKQK